MWFFRRTKKDETKKENETVEEIDVESLKKLIRDTKEEIEYQKGDKLVESLNKIGKSYYDLGEIDKSIEYYEMSLAENNSLGQAYKDLLKLYNIKRQEATERSDDDVVQIYLKKTDDLMQLTKDVIRGRI